MPNISQQKKDKISEQILQYLFSSSPEAKFTADIAVETARDEEFIKSLLMNLKDKKLVIEVTKNPDGKNYTRRKRWLLSNQTYETYARLQKSSNPASGNHA